MRRADKSRSADSSTNAELLIDHAWGYEPCEISDIKSYRPQKRSISSGQVLPEPTVFNDALTIIKEMAEAVSYDLVSENLVTKKLTLTVKYDTSNLENNGQIYTGERKIDSYGRIGPKISRRIKGELRSVITTVGSILSLLSSLLNFISSLSSVSTSLV